MRLNINIPDHCNIIAKYLSGEMLPDEVAEFEKIISSHPENIRLVDDFKNDWIQIGTAKMETPNVDKAWQQVMDRLTHESLVEKNINNTARMQPWLKAVAAVAVLIIISSVYIFTGNISRTISIQSSADPSTLVHTLADGSTVYLEPNTTVTYSKKFGKKERHITLNGEAFFDVTPNPNLPFIVETRDAQVQVLGTSFSVKSAENSSFELVVETGTVNVEAKDKNIEAVIAIAGDRVTYANRQLVKSKQEAYAKPKYKSNRLQFKDQKLANVVQGLNKSYGANITFEQAEIGDRTLTVTFIDSSVRSMVEVICATLGLGAKYQNGTVILWQP